jgi:hypothetical protein
VTVRGAELGLFRTWLDARARRRLGGAPYPRIDKKAKPSAAPRPAARPISSNDACAPYWNLFKTSPTVASAAPPRIASAAARQFRFSAISFQDVQRSATVINPAGRNVYSVYRKSQSRT